MPQCIPTQHNNEKKETKENINKPFLLGFLCVLCPEWTLTEFS
jgi:hypothetical protein